MDEKENKLNEEMSVDNDVNQENDSTLEEKDGVKYETNDNWKFDAEAPTLNDEMFEGIDDGDKSQNYVGNKYAAQDSAMPVNEAYNNGNNQIVINKEPLKFIPLAIFVAAVIAALIVLGVRYYTVPNGKEGDMMNPASVVATIEDNKVSVGMYDLYFSSVVSQYEQYANYGYYDLDTSKDYSEQYTTDEDGNQITWLEFFQQETLNQIKLTTRFIPPL